MYLFDTNAVIYFAQKEPKATERLEEVFASRTPLFIATISMAELFSLPLLPDEERHSIEGILSVLTPAPLDATLARHAGELRAVHRLKLADSIIAATALFTNSALITRNTHDFIKVPTLSIFAI
jgi:predicted nucleic acid-binding protein